jgi:hypothetical protein
MSSPLLPAVAFAGALAAVACLPLRSLNAQRPDSAARPVPAAPSPARVQAQGAVTANRDVVLEVPSLAVDSIGLVVADLQAHLSLDAAAMNFLSLTAGVDVSIKQVRLDITGVQAEAYLYIDLDNVARIVGRVIQTMDRNPQIATQVLGPIAAVPAAAPSVPPPVPASPPPRR